jgi:outer membrane protein
MKRFITLLSLFFVIGAVQSVAQNQKIGFIDSDYILSRMPEYSGLEQRMRAINEEWRKEIEEMDLEIQRLEREFVAREILYTDEVRTQKQTEIENLKRQREQYVNTRYGPEGEYFKQQQLILEPLQRRIMEAVETISTRDNFDYVFDRSGDFLFLYARSQWNLSDDVLLELGVQINP